MKRFFVVFLAVFTLCCTADVPADSYKTMTGQIPIMGNNLRTGEGDFIRLKDGTVRYFFTCYHEEDPETHNMPSDIMFRYSKDNGTTWTSWEYAVLANEGKMNTQSVSICRLKDDRIALFYLVKESATDCRPYMRISDNETFTWGDRIPLITTPSFNTVGNDRAEILESGRILLPVARSAVNADGTRINSAESAETFCLISDDGGTTWREGGRVPRIEGVLYQEPGVCELADGRVLIYIQTDAGCQYFAYSSDGGNSWSEPFPSVLKSPLSPAVIKRIPESGDLMAVWNPLREEKPRGTGSRALMYCGRLTPDGTKLLGRRFLVGTVDEEDQNWQYPALCFLGENEYLTAFSSQESGTNIYKAVVPNPKMLFNGKDLSGWTVFLTGREVGEDPKNVFTVKDGVIHVSGEEFGGISTEEEHSDYHVSLELKWGEKTYPPRENQPRDTGFLFHALGEQGMLSGVWLLSYEANIIEGGIGDFCMACYGQEGYAGTVNVSRSEKGALYFDPKNGTPLTLTANIQGALRKSGYSPSKEDLEKSDGWIKFEVVAEGNTAEFYVNEHRVNRVTDLTRTRGKIQLQSEGAEVFFRNITIIE